MSAPRTAAEGRVAVQRCDRFVARTMNWLYDHLRFVPRHTPLVMCDEIENRDEYPLLEAWRFDKNARTRALWRRLVGRDVDPMALWKLRGRAPRVLHSHFGYVAADDQALQQQLDVPWLIGFYGADVYQLERVPEWHERYAPVFAACSRALALGPVMARHLVALGCPADKVVVHPLGVEVSGLPDRPRVLAQGEPLRVLFAGTFREKKGIQYALDGIARARARGVKLQLDLVAEAAGKPGDRETADEIARLIDKLDLAGCIVRHNFMPFEQLLQLGLQCHVFLAPSVTASDGDSEGTPFVLQQMMGTAMAVIATQHADIPYVFGAHQHLLVPERDAQTIADRLVEYATSPQLVTEHGRLFRAQIVTHFDVRNCAARLSDVYDSVAA